MSAIIQHVMRLFDLWKILGLFLYDVSDYSLSNAVSDKCLDDFCLLNLLLNKDLLD